MTTEFLTSKKAQRGDELQTEDPNSPALADHALLWKRWCTAHLAGVFDEVKHHEWLVLLVNRK